MMLNGSAAEEECAVFFFFPFSRLQSTWHLPCLNFSDTAVSKKSETLQKHN